MGGRLVETPELARQRASTPDFVIAADGGIRHAELLRVTPDAWVGDFDSSDPGDPRFARVPREVAPRDKDLTDAELALGAATAHGATSVTFWGAFGGRFDHTLALALLSVREAARGLEVHLHSGDESATPLLPTRAPSLPTFPGQVLSVLALDELTGLRIAGVRWPLAGVRVPPGSGWTVSNEALGSRALFSVERGRALVVQAWNEEGLRTED